MGTLFMMPTGEVSLKKKLSDGFAPLVKIIKKMRAPHL
jgi:hypothetical protein